MCDMHYQRWRSHGSASVVLQPYGRHAKAGCKVEGCDADAVARKLCGKHYQRWKKYGDPLTVIQDRDQSVEARFWAKVDKDGPVPEARPDLGPCWVWTGGLAEGYGTFWLNGRQTRAHIVSFTWAKGEIEEGQERDHLCRNRACCNPDYFEAVTHWTNVARGISPHGVNTTKTHCPQGHPYDDENTLRNAKGTRTCRECARERSRAWYRRHVAEQAATAEAADEPR